MLSTLKVLWGSKIMPQLLGSSSAMPSAPYSSTATLMPSFLGQPIVWKIVSIVIPWNVFVPSAFLSQSVFNSARFLHGPRNKTLMTTPSAVAEPRLRKYLRAAHSCCSFVDGLSSESRRWRHPTKDVFKYQPLQAEQKRNKNKGYTEILPKERSNNAWNPHWWVFPSNW